MRHALPVVVMLTAALLGSPPRAAAEGIPSGPAAFGWLADLAGSCWSGTLPDGKTRDTQCYAAQFGRFLRGTIRIAQAGADGRERVFDGDGLFAWDAKAGQVSYWTWADNGSVSTGTVVFEGPLVRFLQTRDPQTAGPETRSTWSRLDADSYKVTRQQKGGETWKELFSVVYRRDPPATSAKH